MELEQHTAAFREKVTVRDVSRVAAAAAVSNLADQLAAATALDEPEEAESEEVCTLRVRFPDGRVIRKRFGAKRPAAALFRFCHSVITAEGGGAGATAGRTFRLVRLAGGASDEIRRADASFEQLGLHRSTIYVVFSV